MTCVFRSSEWYDQSRVIVDLDALITLLAICAFCSNNACDVTLVTRKGAYMRFSINCQRCRHTRLWANSTMKSAVPTINMMICAMILFTGSLPSKFLRCLRHLRLSVPSIRTFIRYQRMYLHGVSIYLYLQNFITIM